MSTKQKLDKLMQEDDVFLSDQDKLKIYLEDNWKQLTAIIVGFFFILGGVNYYRSAENSKRIESSTKLALIINSPNGELKAQELDSFIKQEGVKSAKTQAELILAAQNYHQKNFQAALENYNAVETDAVTNDMKDIARLGKAYTLMEMSNYPEAITTLEKMKQNGTNFPEFELNMQIARCNEALGNKAAAVAIYQNIANGLQTSPKKGILEKKISQLSE